MCSVWSAMHRQWMSVACRSWMVLDGLDDFVFGSTLASTICLR